MGIEEGPELGGEATVAERLAESYRAAQETGDFTTEDELVLDLADRVDRGDVTPQDGLAVLGHLFPEES